VVELAVMTQVRELRVEAALMLRSTEYADNVRLDGRTGFELGEAIDKILRLPDLNEIRARVLDDVRYDGVGHMTPVANPATRLHKYCLTIKQYIELYRVYPANNTAILAL